MRVSILNSILAGINKVYLLYSRLLLTFLELKARNRSMT